MRNPSGIGETRARTLRAILMVAMGIALAIGAWSPATGRSKAPVRAAAHHPRHCRPHAGEDVRRRLARLVVLENRRAKAIACVRATGHRATMARGQFNRDAHIFLTGIRRTAGTVIAYDVSSDEDVRQARVLDASTGDRVLLSSAQIGGTSAVRVLLKRDGMLATTIGTYSGSGDPKPVSVEVIICDIADCSPPSDHLVTYGADIDPSSLHRELDQACWTRNVPMRAPQKECAPLSTD